MDCKVQREHCRDQTKARLRKKVEITKVDKPQLDNEIGGQVDPPEKLGDLVTSESIFAIQKSSTNTARHGDTIALVVHDRGTGWVAAYPAKKKAAEQIKGAVNDFLGSEKVKRW